MEEHLAACAVCRRKVEEMERQSTKICGFSPRSVSGGASGWSLMRKSAEEKLWNQEGISLPQKIGPYILTEMLGRGGMGEVYAAVHQILNRKVAVKLIRKKKLLSPEIFERFQKEIAAAGKLVHPNIVTATDAGSFDGTPFLVMEFLSGQTLTEYTESRGGVLALAEAEALTLQAAKGLKFAHDSGFIHCDVKPSNLWRTPEGIVKVLDLGIWAKS